MRRILIRDIPPACLFENPYGLVSLWHMRFQAVKAIKALELLAKVQMNSILGGRDTPSSPTLHRLVQNNCED